MASDAPTPSGKLGRAVFCGLARNSGDNLPLVLANIDAMASLFDEVAFIMVENDSDDATKATLKAWCAERPNARLMEFDGLDQQVPIRTLRLARLRKLCVSLVKAEFAHFDYMIPMDCDDANILPINLDAVRRAVEFLAADPICAAVFPNQDGLYVDTWALRCDGWCTGDIWEDALDYSIEHRVSDEEAFNQTARQVGAMKLDPQLPPFQVYSAFGGTGIYKIGSVLRNRRNYIGYKTKTLPVEGGSREFGWQTCEHVSFNLGFIEMGQTLYILPFWLNRLTPVLFLKPSAFHAMIFELGTLGSSRSA